jgi:hypothetical protein
VGGVQQQTNDGWSRVMMRRGDEEGDHKKEMERENKDEIIHQKIKCRMACP